MIYLRKIFENDSYEWIKISETPLLTKYTFQDFKGNEYLVEFTKKELGHELKYYVKDDKQYSVSKLVSANPFKLVRTILSSILEDFLKNSSVQKVYLDGLSKDQEKNFISQRTKLYMRQLNTNGIDGFRIENYGNRINIIRC